MAILSGWKPVETPNLGNSAMEGYKNAFSMYSSIMNTLNSAFNQIKRNNTEQAAKEYYQAILNSETGSLEDAMKVVKNPVNLTSDNINIGHALAASKANMDVQKYRFNSEKNATDFNYALKSAYEQGNLAEYNRILQQGRPDNVLFRDLSIPSWLGREKLAAEVENIRAQRANSGFNRQVNSLLYEFQKYNVEPKALLDSKSEDYFIKNFGVTKDVYAAAVNAYANMTSNTGNSAKQFLQEAGTQPTPFINNEVIETGSPNLVLSPKQLDAKETNVQIDDPNGYSKKLPDNLFNNGSGVLQVSDSSSDTLSSNTRNIPSLANAINDNILAAKQGLTQRDIQTATAALDPSQYSMLVDEVNSSNLSNRDSEFNSIISSYSVPTTDQRRLTGEYQDALDRYNLANYNNNLSESKKSISGNPSDSREVNLNELDPAIESLVNDFISGKNPTAMINSKNIKSDYYDFSILSPDAYVSGITYGPISYGSDTLFRQALAQINSPNPNVIQGNNLSTQDKYTNALNQESYISNLLSNEDSFNVFTSALENNLKRDLTATEKSNIRASLASKKNEFKALKEDLSEQLDIERVNSKLNSIRNDYNIIASPYENAKELVNIENAGELALIADNFSSSPIGNSMDGIVRYTQDINKRAKEGIVPEFQRYTEYMNNSSASKYADATSFANSPDALNLFKEKFAPGLEPNKINLSNLQEFQEALINAGEYVDEITGPGTKYDGIPKQVVYGIMVDNIFRESETLWGMFGGDYEIDKKRFKNALNAANHTFNTKQGRSEYESWKTSTNLIDKQTQAATTIRTQSEAVAKALAAETIKYQNLIKTQGNNPFQQYNISVSQKTIESYRNMLVSYAAQMEQIYRNTMIYDLNSDRISRK